MKWILIIALLAALGWGGYEWLDDVMRREAFGSAIEAAIDDPRVRGLEQIRAEIRTAAEREGLAVAPEAIELVVTASDRQPVAGLMVGGAGLQTTMRRMTVRVQYEREVWGQRRSDVIERSKVYIASAATPSGPQDRVLGQIP